MGEAGPGPTRRPGGRAGRHAQGVPVGTAGGTLPGERNVVVPPAATVPLWLSFRTVTALPATVSRPFHNWVIADPLACVQVTVQDVMAAVPVLRTTTSPWKPPG